MFNLRRRFSILAIGAIAGLMAGVASADPLPGEKAKFSQAPLYNTPVFGAIYNGHDELSTANLGVNSAGGTDYSGTFMADDFADLVSTPRAAHQLVGIVFEQQHDCSSAV